MELRGELLEAERASQLSFELLKGVREGKLLVSLSQGQSSGVRGF